MQEVMASRDARTVPNARARASFLVGLCSAIAMPVGIGYAVWTHHKTGTAKLTETYAAMPVAVVLGLLAVFLGRSARRHSWISLGRVGGARLARGGSILGLIGLYLGAMALLALGFYGLLLLFE